MVLMHDVVVAEDHPLFLEALVSVFSGMPEINRVHEASNGHQALSLVQAHRPALAVLDIRMPQLDGLAVAAKLQQEYPAVRVLLISTSHQTAIVRQALEKGAHGFLLKEANATEIQLAARTVLSGECYLSAQLAQALAMERLRPENRPILTPREQQIVRLLCQEQTTAQIADALALSERTVERLRSDILLKTGAQNAVGIVKYAVKHGLIEE